MQFMLATTLLALANQALAPAAPSAWEGSVAAVADEAIATPAARDLRSLVVADIVEARTLARWDLSDRLERAITDALSARPINAAILGRKAIEEIENSSSKTKDGVLAGTFQKDAARAEFKIALLIRDLRTGATLARLTPFAIAAGALPPGSVPETGFGRLVLNVEPVTAWVYLDGKFLGHGPRTLSVLQGAHVVTASQRGFEVFDQAIDVSDESPKTMTIRLKRSTYALAVEASEIGALVFIDGQKVGHTPLESSGLSPGKHHVSVTAEGFRPFEADVAWEEGAKQVLKAVLEPLPGSLLVTADVGEARVEVDGADKGKVPLLVEELRVGKHQIRVLADSNLPYVSDVEIRTGRTVHLRARLGAEAVVDTRGFDGTAIIPRTHSQIDLELASLVHRSLTLRHPDFKVLDPGLSLRRLRGQFSEDEVARDPERLRSVAMALKAKQITVVGVERYTPFERSFGFWPERPQLVAQIGSQSGIGPKDVMTLTASRQGGEPWFGSQQAQGLRELTADLGDQIADTLAGRSGPTEEPEAKRLLQTASVFLGDGRAGPGIGFLYERRILAPFEVGIGYAYANALGKEGLSGPTVRFAGAAEELRFGIGQNHQIRTDALFRWDGGPPRSRQWFSGERWVPYAGAGLRLNVPRYEVYGVGRKESEGGYYWWEPKASLLGGIKLQIGGLVLRLELELAMLAVTEDSATPTLTFAAGRLL